MKPRKPLRPPTDRPLLERARQLRTAQTDAEARAWSILRGRRLAGYKFRRQYSIGGFIADFCCVERMLVIETDGGQRLERGPEDSARTKYLEACGYRVLRFWNDDVLKNPEGVAVAILDALQSSAGDGGGASGGT